jgi:D-alanyl-lipoteichoic acid acyltransferase DltB (MBOAT superfamily)
MLVLATVFTLGRVLHWEQPVSIGTSVSVVLYSLEMWAVLRLMTLFWEVGSGVVPLPSLNSYVVWISLPFTLVGPLLRFSQMPRTVKSDRQLWRSSDWWLELTASTAKLAAGLGLSLTQSMMLNQWPQSQWSKAGLTFVTGPIGFYLVTAGYFQLMEVLGRPAGFQLPPSFNLPIGRQNVSEFWMNWNMTATFTFRDYLFYNRWGMNTYNVYLNTMILFTLVGLWHAANAYWILWGFLHGLLFCSFMLWRKHRNVIGEFPLRGNAISLAAARVFTYVCVCMCWYIPSKVIQRVGMLL